MSRAVSEPLRKKIAHISLLILDVDGVLTDGRIIIDDDGKETKQFDVKDGHGIKMLLRTGVEVMFLTGRRSRVVAHRAQDLGVREVHQGVRNKLAVFETIIRDKKIPAERIAYMGDDIVDVPLFKHVGFSATVADACEEARKSCDYVTEKGGGRGAVREVCELILRIQGKWDEIVSKYDLKSSHH